MNTTILPLPAVSPIAQAIRALYHVASDLDAYIDRHIEELRASPNPTISRTGRVLEAAKEGFGIGYISSATVIAAGQFLLGNQLGAAATLASAATMTNPVVMTCAAMGAVIYGFYALDEADRNDLLAKLSEGLAIGIQLIHSILDFVIETAKALLSKDNLVEIKKFIAENAAAFGRTLGEVTGRISDRAHDALVVIKEKTGDVSHTLAEGAGTLVEAGRQVGKRVAQKLPHRHASDNAGDTPMAQPSKDVNSPADEG